METLGNKLYFSFWYLVLCTEQNVYCDVSCFVQRQFVGFSKKKLWGLKSNKEWEVVEIKYNKLIKNRID